MEEIDRIIPSKVLYGPFGSGGQVNGHCSGEWGAVLEAFEENFAQGLENGAQLSIFSEGKCVLDLCGKSSAQRIYSRDSIQTMFSSGKNMEALCIALLVDRKILAYDDFVCKYWPEFGKHGREEITVSDILRHEGGVPFLSDPTAINNGRSDSRLTLEDIRLIEPMERKIENAGRYGVRHYHAITRGWVLSGLIRRVDDKARTLAHFMREEVSERLGLRIYCGVPISDQADHKIADVADVNLTYLYLTEGLPHLLGAGDPVVSAAIKLIQRKDYRSVIGRHARVFRLKTDGAKALEDMLNSPEGRAMEWPSGGMLGNAHSMAKVASVLACGGATIDGVQLISPSTLALALSEPRSAFDVVVDSTYSFTKGGFSRYSDFDSRYVTSSFRQDMDGFFGWGGRGGSFFLFHPEKRLSVGYCMNGLAPQYLIGGPRTDRIMQAVQRVLRRL